MKDHKIDIGDIRWGTEAEECFKIGNPPEITWMLNKDGTVDTDSFCVTWDRPQDSTDSDLRPTGESKYELICMLNEDGTVDMDSFLTTRDHPQGSDDSAPRPTGESNA